MADGAKRMAGSEKRMRFAQKRMAGSEKRMRFARKRMAGSEERMRLARKRMAGSQKRMRFAQKRMAGWQKHMRFAQKRMADSAEAMAKFRQVMRFTAKTGTFRKIATQTQPNRMAIPLKWNAKGAKWSPKLKWNGVLPSNLIMKTIAVIDFTPYTALELEPTAQVIHDKMLENEATFDDPDVPMTALATLISTYHAAQAARASNANADILAFNLARHNLEAGLHDLGVYVNYVAKGDPVIVEQSGFPSYGAAPAPLNPIPAAPVLTRLRNGDLPGSVTARIKADRANSMNLAQVNTGDPNNEAGWHTVMTFPRGTVTISGLTSASVVWVRFATVGPKGVIGAWSDPARIVVQ